MKIKLQITLEISKIILNLKNNASTLKDYANEKYGDDSNPIFDMIQEIIKNIFDSF